jgi:DNA-binding transcriptional regulator YhcF (GntR family)
MQYDRFNSFYIFNYTYFNNSNNILSQKNEMQTELLTLEQYAKKTGISVKTAYNRYKKGLLKENIVYKGKQPLIISKI